MRMAIETLTTCKCDEGEEGREEAAASGQDEDDPVPRQGLQNGLDQRNHER